MKTSKTTPPELNFNRSTHFVLLCCTIFILPLFFSCSDEDAVQTESKNSDTISSNSGISVTSEGYLNFATQEAFENLISQLDSAGTNNSSTKSSKILAIDGFNSIAVLKNSELKSSELDDEEMTADEYNVMRAENLLVDPVLTNVMDTTLRIGIAGQLYKINEYGTFSAPKQYAENINAAIANFDTANISTVKTGASIDLGNNVTFTNTFGNGSIQDAISMVKDSTSLSVLRSTSDNLYSDYNVNSYEWKHHSVVQNIWDAITGKDVTRENNFSSNRRVQVELFNVNYLLYASAGIKVKMQKKKKFLFVSYWVGTDCDKIAVGFEKIYGVMKWNNPQSYSSLPITGSAAWGRSTGIINNYLFNWMYTSYHKLDLVKDWVDDIYYFLPEITLSGSTYPNYSEMNKMYNAPVDYVVSFLKQQVGKWVYSPIKAQIQPKDPMISYLIWGNTITTYNEGKSFIRGVKEYTNTNSKTIRFSQSFGINVINGVVTGFIPNEFKIKEIDCFGAAYYSGAWKGIRFISE